MKILSIGNFGIGWDGSICDEEHIAKALEDLGNEVIRWQREDMDGYRENVMRADFTLISQYDNYPVDLLEYLPSPVVYWAFDYQDKGQEWHERLVRESDLYLSKPFKDSFHDNWRWCSQDFAPDFLDKVDGVEKDIDVLFTGSWVPWESGQERVKMLHAIEDAGFNLQINSVTQGQWEKEGFKNCQGPVMDDALPELISRAKINLSMDHVYSPGYWSDRNAQIMCSGGFVLFRHVPFSEATFGINIAYFYDEETCIDSIAYYLEHDEEREAIANQGYNYAQIFLHAHNRAHQMLTIVGEIL